VQGEDLTIAIILILSTHPFDIDSDCLDAGEGDQTRSTTIRLACFPGTVRIATDTSTVGGSSEKDFRSPGLVM
jgi:hypothetical protein